MKNSSYSLNSYPLHFPTWGKGLVAVWRTNFLHFRYSLFISIFSVAIEPLLIFLAIGYGVGHLIGNLDGDSYITFFFPAMMANAGMFISFFEASYGSHNKLSSGNIYHAILLTPVEPSELIFGEILWATSKGTLSSVIIALAGASQGLVDTWLILPCLLIMFMLCWVAASFGYLLNSFSNSHDWFLYAQSGILIPMSLFSGTYFPLSQLPETLQQITYIFPLTHAVMAARALLAGDIPSILFFNLGILFGLGFLLSHWATNRMVRRIFI